MTDPFEFPGRQGNLTAEAKTLAGRLGPMQVSSLQGSLSAAKQDDKAEAHRRLRKIKGKLLDNLECFFAVTEKFARHIIVPVAPTLRPPVATEDLWCKPVVLGGSDIS